MSLLEAVGVWAFLIMLSSQGPKSLSFTFLWKLGKPITWLSTWHLLHASVFKNMGSRNEHCPIALPYTIPKFQVVPKGSPCMYQ